MSNHPVRYVVLAVESSFPEKDLISWVDRIIQSGIVRAGDPTNEREVQLIQKMGMKVSSAVMLKDDLQEKTKVKALVKLPE
jgi:hypothetical protein